tara:strand:+ start:125 stop:331 length:207 start_codon:yes stop_codon:yes gene_type:complete
MKRLDNMAILFPILAILLIVVFAGGLGVIFTVIHESTHSEIGVLILGTALVIGVPAAAALIQRRIERT